MSVSIQYKNGATEFIVNIRVVSIDEDVLHLDGSKYKLSRIKWMSIR